MPPDRTHNQPDDEILGEHAAGDGDDDMAKRRTLVEAADALGVHLVTLQRWMRQEGIKAERDTRDKRFKWLEERDVERLARQHRRTIRQEPSREHVASRLRDCERRIEELEAVVAELRAASTRAAQLLAPPADPYEPYTPRPRGGVRTRPLGPVAVLPLLPEGWIACRRWGEDHGIDYWAIDRAIHGERDADGHLTLLPVLEMHQNKWRSRHPRPVRVTEAFDPEQQEAARLHFGK